MSSEILLVRPIGLIVLVIALITPSKALIMPSKALIMSNKTLIVCSITLVVCSVWASGGLLAVRVHVARGVVPRLVVWVISTHRPLLLLSSVPGVVHVLRGNRLLLWWRQIVHFDLLFQHNLLGVGRLPARHSRQGIGIMLGDVELGILRRSMNSWRSESWHCRGRWHMGCHGCLLTISSGLLWIVWFVEVLVGLSTRSIAATAAVAATLETIAAAAAA
jgi:hypothetical protein